MSDCELDFFSESESDFEIQDDNEDDPIEFWEQTNNVKLWETLRNDAPFTKEGMIAKMLNIYQINDILETSAKKISNTMTCMDNWLWAKQIIIWKFGYINRLDANIDSFIELLSKKKPFGLIT